MRTLSVLLTNNALAAHAGSEAYLRDVALALLRRGHRPVAFSLVHGAVSDELRRATVPVVDDLARLGRAPDVVHGHHHLETLMAALAFPDTPIVHFCHGWIPWEEKPLRHPSIRRYVAVDEVCADRLVHEEGIDEASVETLLNFVDLSRFRPRAPLPRRPRRALVFSNGASSHDLLRPVRAACDAHGIALDAVGLAAGNAVPDPEHLLPQYDLVFAKARAALEAMAVGCAVILNDWVGAGPLVTPENFDRLRRRNFGVRELQRPLDVEWHTAQIAAYDADAASRVRDRVRAEADLERAVDRIVSLYEQAIAAPRRDGDGQRAAMEHLQRVGLTIKGAWASESHARLSDRNLELARAERDRLGAELAALGARAKGVEEDLAAAESERDEAMRGAADASARERARYETAQRLEAELYRVRQHTVMLERALAEYRGLTTLRMRDAIVGLPIIGPTAHRAARLVSRLLRA